MKRNWGYKLISLLVAVILLTASFDCLAVDVTVDEDIIINDTLDSLEFIEELEDEDLELKMDELNPDIILEVDDPDKGVETDEAISSNAFPKKITLGVNEKYALKGKKGMKYQTSDKKVATVSSSGVIVAKGVGKATITITSGKKSVGKCQVTVKKLPSKVTLNKSKITLKISDTFQLKTSLPKNTYTSKYTWTSSDKKVAKVDGTGLVTAVNSGKATITVKTGNGKTAKCVVTVKNRTELSKYFWGNIKTAAKKFKLKFDSQTVDDGITITNYYGSDNTGGMYFVTEDGKHTCLIYLYSQLYMIDGIYVGMSKSKAISMAKSKGWRKDNSDNESVSFENDSNQWMSISTENNTVSGVTVRCYEIFNVIHPEYTDGDGHYYPESDFFSDGYDMLPTAGVGDTGTLVITSNVDWKVEETDAIESGWLDVSPQKGSEGTSEVKLTIKKAPPSGGGTFHSTLKFTTGSGREYSGNVWLDKPGIDSVAVTSVSLDRDSLSMSVGQSIQLNATVLPSDATNKSLTWESSNPSVASVSESGVVMANSDGDAIISATAANGVSASCKVTVLRPTVSGSFSKKTISVKEGSSATVTVKGKVTNGKLAKMTVMYARTTGTYEEGEVPNGSWTYSGGTSTSKTLKIDASNSPFNIAGTYELRLFVKAADGTVNSQPLDTCTVTVIEKPATQVSGSFSKKTISVKEGSSATVTVKGKVTNGKLAKMTVMYARTTGTYEEGEVPNGSWTYSSGTSTSKTLKIDASNSPFNIAGTYELRLFVKAADGTVNSQPLDTCTVTVMPETNFSVRHGSDIILGVSQTSGTTAMDSNAGSGDYYTLTIDSNYDWTVSVSNTTWVTPSKTSDSSGTSDLVLTLKNIEEGKTYSTKLTFKVNGATRTVTAKLDKKQETGKPEYVAIDPCDFVASQLKSTVQDGTEYDQTNYPLSAGNTYPIPFSTGKNVLRVTYTLSIKDSNGNWGQYGDLKETLSYTSGSSGHSGTFSMKLPSDMQSGNYLVRVYAKNMDSDNGGDYICVKAKIYVKGEN